MDGGFYVFPRELKACADRRLNNATIRRLWQGFCCQAGQIVMEEADGVFFRAGAIPVPEVPGKAEFVIRVTEQGMAVAAKDYSGLARGVLVLMMRIEPVALEEGREQFRVAACSVEGNYGIRSRMIHFCVFPETTPAFLQKCIRLAGVMQYTHVVLEFWGMLRYDCLAIILTPLLWSISMSFDKTATTHLPEFSLIPHEPSTFNYKAAAKMIDLPQYFKNTVIVVVVNTFLAVMFSMMCGFAFAKLKFVGKKFWFILALWCCNICSRLWQDLRHPLPTR